MMWTMESASGGWDGPIAGGPLVQLLISDGAAGVSRVVLASSEAFDNFPPGLTGKTTEDVAQLG
jgi:hypothetical protein